MLVKDFLTLYREDGFVKTISEQLKDSRIFPHIQLKGLSGSLDAVMVSALFQSFPQTYLLVLNDREEAAYFLNDLQNLLGDQHVLSFPMSYKKAYQYEEIDNANVLIRAEVLNKLNNSKEEGIIIVTYPEALSEKVINKRSLLKNTFTITVGEKLDTGFLGEVLASYDFEKTDFVYEAGQYSIRGGIVDVFSYANELPFRIDLFGDEVESVRTFDPESQLSVESVSKINIIPDVQTKLVQETRESFLSFFPENARIWFREIDLVLEIIDNSFKKVEASLQEIVGRSGGIKVVSDPNQLFETRRGFLNQIKTFGTVEFGRRFYFKSSPAAEVSTLNFKAKAQPSFNKDFKRLSDNLRENQGFHFVNIISSESHKQLERLEVIFSEIDQHVRFQSLNISLREGFIDENLKLACYTDHQIFDRFHRFREKNKYSKSKALTLKELRTLQVGDFVTHVDYGIGRFAGLDKIKVGDSEQEAIRLVYRDDDLLSVSIHSLHKIAKYSGKEGGPPIISKLGSQDWENKKSRVKKQVKDIAKELIMLYAKRRTAPGFAFSQDSFMQAELESSFLYEDTPDQAKSTADVKADMEKPHPMDRLVCGDVGFGKTEVAIRSAFKAVADSKQVAVLVPTTVLAMQHFRTFRDRLEKFPCRVEYINRFKSDKQIKETLKRVANGETDILIGTHRIVNKDVLFKDLGLMIIDEEQKFGVKVKDRLKEMRVNVDVLTLTATPIPRTLHFSLMGARDLSVIATPPPNRQPVTTELHVFNEVLLRDAVSYELKRGGQVYFVHNRVNELESIANTILRMVPDAKIGIAHGQMDGEKLEKVMMSFIEGHYDVLVSTNIIESGLDIPNANTIFINHANHFGLSDLHQMRGRVGRSNKKAFCFLLTPTLSALTSDARKRLSALEEFTDLGDGFKVAMRDLDIRGAGNLLGAEQSGFINDLGYELYHKILDEAVQELKEQEFRDLFEKDLLETVDKLSVDCQIETDLQVLIPEKYVSSISERLSLYTKLDDIKDNQELETFQNTIKDRFGPIPPEVEDMIEIVRVRWVAESLGIEKIILKNNNLKLYFVSSENEKYYKSDIFGKILEYVKVNSRKCQLKEAKGKLILNVEKISSIHEMKVILSDIKG
ncbi:transcription-repair coupling factor (superfamily II helicase) [Pseudarcicella hirudinis]|uniref:Transcription-repair-coupling factor n=1 Tax=Pseudarcicella hirudinis TaxID=1079859 RepID=A0A1I5QEW1_9BACT|nr:transcription-repair coupling factor [Pseudarcicella hirudinis]SFP44773.1 transcription-repair coupling factor (superfamily II helicase) [Pseudarcicella hirudinis]